MNKSYLCALMITMLVLVFTANFGVVQASTDVTGIISSDTTWTKANSSYSLTGNVLVDNGVTLSIETGVTVNLNDFYLMINGTLRAHGTEADRIMFYGSEISFTKYSSNWNEQTGSGCIIENANLDSTQLKISSTSVKVTGCSISEITIGGSTVLTYNTIHEKIMSSSTVNSPIITHNTILNGAYLQKSGSALVSNNIISGSFDILEGSFTISSNTFSGSLIAGNSGVITNNTVSGSLDVGGSVVVSNNTVSGNLRAGGLAVVTDNIVMNGVIISQGDYVVISDNLIYGGINVSPGTGSVNTTIIDNTITGGETGISIPSTCYIFLIASSRTDAYISGNTISGFSTDGIKVGGIGPSPAGGPYLTNYVVIEENTIIDTNCAVKTSGEGAIRNNVITHNEVGISGGNLIEGNLIMNNTCGIWGGNEIRRNTIVNNDVGIRGSPTTIVYNNIYNNSEYNVDYLGNSGANATYNWWGTTDSEAISQKIHDYYEDFYLGIVNFTPFLTESNPEAPPIQNVIIPEFTSWILLPLFLAATFFVVAVRKKIVCGTITR